MRGRGRGERPGVATALHEPAADQQPRQPLAHLDARLSKAREPIAPRTRLRSEAAADPSRRTRPPRRAQRTSPPGGQSGPTGFSAKRCRGVWRKQRLEEMDEENAGPGRGHHRAGLRGPGHSGRGREWAGPQRDCGDKRKSAQPLTS